MNKIRREVTIDARMDKVFEFLANPNNLPEIWPNVLEVKNITPSKVSGAFDFDWAYSMAEVRLDARAETVKYHQYDSLEVKSQNGLESAIGWKLAPNGGKGTRLTLEMDYEIPDALADKAAAQKLIQENERHVDDMLENLKKSVEAETAYAGA